LDRERQILADLIRQRGFTNVAGVYELEKDSRNACHIAPELRGPITIAQDTFSVELNDPANLLALKGVIVESAMAAARSEEAITATFFVGDIANRQIELGMAGAGISCKIGRLLRHGTQPQ